MFNGITARVSVFTVAAVMLLAGCAANGATERWIRLNTSDNGPMTPSEKLDRKLMVTETSPIPGATARVIPASSPSNAAPSAGYCVTNAGYCPLATQTPAGQNCLCQTSNLAYGGLTGAAPQTYEPP